MTHSPARVLIVRAHPEPLSLCSALADAAHETLTERGHQVAISDLYGMDFAPVIKPGTTIVGSSSAGYFSPDKAQESAWAQDRQPLDVVDEQNKVAEADLLLLHFPMWWFSMPAILKGWVDRVFSRGFAYSQGRKYDQGHFVGKRAMLCVTTGTSAATYEPSGIDGDISHVLWPIHNGILAYTGCEVLAPHVAYMPGRVTEEVREEYLRSYRHRLSNLQEETPLFFHPTSDYDEDLRLKPGVPARSGVQWNPRADQTRDDAVRSEGARR